MALDINKANDQDVWQSALKIFRRSELFVREIIVPRDHGRLFIEREVQIILDHFTFFDPVADEYVPVPVSQEDWLHVLKTTFIQDNPHPQWLEPGYHYGWRWDPKARYFRRATRRGTTIIFD